jgi:hypothetical protein
MYFVFEKIVDELPLNLTNCEDVNKSSIGRITVSPVTSTLLRILRTEAQLHREYATAVKVVLTPPVDETYIIPVGVAHSPYDWCGPDTYKNGYNEDFPNRKSLFAFINEQYLEDLRNGKAYLLIDQTHEGYQSDWMWQWFHNNCNEYGIHPGKIIYITGNMDCSKQYNKWADECKLVPRILTIPLAHFEHVVNEISNSYDTGHLPPGVSERRKLPTFETHIEHKTADLSKIAMFNILQKRPRAYRQWFFKHIYDAGLIKGNIVTMNKFDVESTYFEGRKMDTADFDKLDAILPMIPIENPPAYTPDNFYSGDGANYVLSLNDLTILDSWCTVVSEASYGDSEGACFISEKTFKPIACQQPFIILGSKNILKNLKEMGYKTFHPYIDESYDELPTWERMQAITKELVRLNAMSDQERLEWFKNLEPIIKHNFDTLKTRTSNYVKDMIETIKAHLEK